MSQYSAQSGSRHADIRARIRFVQACRLTDTKRLKEMKMSVKEAMDTATELFSAMVFKWGFVQADPHPGEPLFSVR